VTYTQTLAKYGFGKISLKRELHRRELVIITLSQCGCILRVASEYCLAHRPMKTQSASGEVRALWTAISINVVSE